jgi:hypothetical protein
MKRDIATISKDSNEATVVAMLDRMELEVARATTFEQLNGIANSAAGIQRAFKGVKEIADRAGVIWVKADRKLGGEWHDQPKATGTRGQLTGDVPKGSRVGGRDSRPPTAPTIQELGLSKDRLARAVKLHELTDVQLADLIQRLKDDGRGVSPARVLVESRSNEKRDKQFALANAVFSADGPFDVVVIDPPWKMQKIDRDPASCDQAQQTVQAAAGYGLHPNHLCARPKYSQTASNRNACEQMTRP